MQTLCLEDENFRVCSQKKTFFFLFFLLILLQHLTFLLQETQEQFVKTLRVKSFKDLQYFSFRQETLISLILGIKSDISLR